MAVVADEILYIGNHRENNNSNLTVSNSKSLSINEIQIHERMLHSSTMAVAGVLAVAAAPVAAAIAAIEVAAAAAAVAVEEAATNQIYKEKTTRSQ